nr:T9SS type A sorting domain-containing protein [Chitinophagaceae bacterium]
KATINWSVSEINISSFEVEKSSDGYIFNSIGKINSKGNGVNSYLFNDPQKLSNTSYYRIKQLSNNGNYGYSNILKLSRESISITLYPNPTNKQLLVTINDELKWTQVQLYDFNGKLLRIFKLNNQTTSLSIEHLPKGTYILKFENGKTKQFVKQ